MSHPGNTPLLADAHTFVTSGYTRGERLLD